MIETTLDLLDIVAFADPSGSKSEVKKVQARSAIAVLAGDAYDRIFVLEAWCARTSTDAFVAKMFELNDRWHPRVFGVEANAMQSLFVDMLRRESRLRAVRVPFVDVRQPTRVEKPFRNRSALQGIINEGRLLMLTGASQIEARNELETHPMCAQFDIVDSIASASGLLRRTSKEEAASGEALDLARYLRRTGAPPSYIEQKLAGLRGGPEHAVPPRPDRLTTTATVGKSR